MYEILAKHYREFPKLSCCEKIKEYPCVCLTAWDKMNDQGVHDMLLEPKWQFVVQYLENRYANHPEYANHPDATFISMTAGITVDRCPFCAAPVPAVRLKVNPPTPLEVVTDGGYYCDTCEERCSNCVCYPMVTAWEVDD